ncbi:DUF6232 family protein [Deinococcus arenae]|uniref:DUF6232 family protein n=1 Tax=Deinococcus arenae TaxID=1452751 RepID=UPI001666E64E|nr:DUF6232 family protein [Deinococcus arenae]
METTFYQDAGATVTNARFITGNQMHAMSGITSVNLEQESPLTMGPVLLGIIGVIALLAREWMIGLAMIVAAVVWKMNQRTNYIITIRTAAGELKALQGSDRDRITKIVAALNDAIVHRG